MSDADDYGPTSSSSLMNQEELILPNIPSENLDDLSTDLHLLEPSLTNTEHLSDQLENYEISSQVDNENESIILPNIVSKTNDKSTNQFIKTIIKLENNSQPQNSTGFQKNFIKIVRQPSTTPNILKNTLKYTAKAPPVPIKQPKCLICENVQITAHSSTEFLNQDDFKENKFDSSKVTISLISSLLEAHSEFLKFFAKISSLPFCEKCLGGVGKIVKIKEKIKSLETELRNEIQNLREQVKQSLGSGKFETKNFISASNYREEFRKRVIIDGQKSQQSTSKISPTKKTSLKSNSLTNNTSVDRKPIFVTHISQLTNNNKKVFKSPTLISNNSPADINIKTELSDSCEIENEIFPSLLVDVNLTEGYTENEKKFQINCSSSEESDADSEPSNKKRKTAIQKHTSISSDSIDPLKMYLISDYEILEEQKRAAADRAADLAAYEKYMELQKNQSAESSSNLCKVFLPSEKRVPKLKYPASWGKFPWKHFKVTKEGQIFYENYEIKCIEDDPQNLYFFCVTCEKNFYLTEFRRVKKKEKKLPFRHMIDHIKTIHKEIYKCHECNLVMKSITLYKDHFNKTVKHNMNYYQFSHITCEVCGRVCPKLRYREHVWTHKSQEEKDECIKNGETEPPKRKTTKRKKSNFTCERCRSGFVLEKSYEAHLKTSSCAFEIDFLCTQCGKTFKTRDLLTVHTRKIHEPDRIPVKFYCKFCHKRFANESTYKTHLMTHTGEKPFPCTICSKSFRRKFHLKKHLISCAKKYEASSNSDSSQDQSNEKNNEDYISESEGEENSNSNY